MSNYNKHINSFSAQTEYNLYIYTEDCQVPNVAYIEENDTVKMLKVKPQEITGEVGGIYYSDGTTTGHNDAVDRSKTPIGVILVAPTKDNGLKTTIMSVYNITEYGTDDINNNAKCCYGISDTAAATTDDLYIPNDDDGYQDITVYSGKEFTYSLIGNNGSDAQAAYACYSYSTEGTEAGDWYLPSISEFKQLYYTHKIDVDDSLTKLKYISKGYELSSINGYWSSSEYADTSARNFNLDDGESYSGLNKTINLPVRAFCTIDPFKNL